MESPSAGHSGEYRFQALPHWLPCPDLESTSTGLWSEHGGLSLQDGRGAGAPGKLGGALVAVAADRCGVRPVVPPPAALEGQAPPRPPQLALDLIARKSELR